MRAAAEALVKRASHVISISRGAAPPPAAAGGGGLVAVVCTFSAHLARTVVSHGSRAGRCRSLVARCEAGREAGADGVGRVLELVLKEPHEATTKVV